MRKCPIHILRCMQKYAKCWESGRGVKREWKIMKNVKKAWESALSVEKVGWKKSAKIVEKVHKVESMRKSEKCCESVRKCSTCLESMKKSEKCWESV